MVEIGYRTNAAIYEVTASDILKERDPQAYFEGNVDNAIGGVVFVDVSLLLMRCICHGMVSLTNNVYSFVFGRFGPE